MAKILVLHGPNLNLLGTREPEQYGTITLDEINAALVATAEQHDHTIDCFQSNAEHELVDKIQAGKEAGVTYIIINPAAFTHTSVAIRDALAGTAIPFIEVHLSNIQARENFRQHSYFSELATGVISGLGAYGYQLALLAIIKQLS